MTLPPPPTYAPEPTWPTDAPPTPFPPPQALPAAAALRLPTAPEIAGFAPALRPDSVGDLAAQADRSVYQLALQLDPARQTLLGHERITLTNRTAGPLRQVVVRLYPNFPGVFDERITPTGFGRLQVGEARVGDAPGGNRLSRREHRRRHCAAGAAGARRPPERLELEFRLSHAGLGPAPDMWYFKSFYPMLAVYDAGGWRLGRDGLSRPGLCREQLLRRWTGRCLRA